MYDCVLSLKLFQINIGMKTTIELSLVCLHFHENNWEFSTVVSYSYNRDVSFRWSLQIHKPKMELVIRNVAETPSGDEMKY